MEPTMPFDATPTRRTLTCHHCGGELGNRTGNTLQVKSLSIEFKRTALLNCAECGKSVANGDLVACFVQHHSRKTFAGMFRSGFQESHRQISGKCLRS